MISDLITDIYIFQPPNAVHISIVYYTYTKKPTFTMTQRMYFHAPKCTFNSDPIWDQKWNCMDPWHIFHLTTPANHLKRYSYKKSHPRPPTHSMKFMQQGKE